MLGIMPPQASTQPQRPPAYGCRKCTIVQLNYFKSYDLGVRSVQ